MSIARGSEIRFRTAWTQDGRMTNEPVRGESVPRVAAPTGAERSVADKIYGDGELPADADLSAAPDNTTKE